MAGPDAMQAVLATSVEVEPLIIPFPSNQASSLDASIPAVQPTPRTSSGVAALPSNVDETGRAALELPMGADLEGVWSQNSAEAQLPTR